MWPKPPKRKKERRERKQERQEAYARARISYFIQLAARQGRSVATCEVCEEAPAVSIHHKEGRLAENLTDTTKFLGVCVDCDAKVHGNPEWAYSMGYMLRRIE